MVAVLKVEPRRKLPGRRSLWEVVAAYADLPDLVGKTPGGAGMETVAQALTVDRLVTAVIDKVKGSSEMGAKPDDHNRGVSQRACAQCGAELRRGNVGTLCELCSRRLPDVAQRLRETGFFTLDSVRRMLARYDFGWLFRAVRRSTELTQTELGALLDLEQDRISRIERGKRPLRDIADVARVASRLGIPPVLLGFGPDTTTVEKTATSEIEEVDWVRRRNFSWAAAGVLLGVGITGLDIERLAALLHTDPPQSPMRIGAADVTAIERATGVFRSLGASHGGALWCPAIVAQLQSALPLQDANCTDEVRERLLVATADLGMVAAWASYDAERHNDARHIWLIALSLAAQAEHPRAADLSAHLLMCMTNQALHLRRPEEASNLIQLAYHSATRNDRSLPASTASYLALHQAWSHAAQHDTRACDHALGHAVERFTQVDPATAPPWAAHITADSVAAHQGNAYHTLTLTTADSKHAAQAVPLLQQAVEGFGTAHARSRAIHLPGLAASQAMLGDLDSAARTGHQAVAEITALALPRAYDRLRSLNTVLAIHHGNPAIGEVREKIQTALLAA